MTTKNPEILEDTPLESRKNVLELSRTALAEKLHMSESELPDGTFFRIVDAELDKLAGLDPAKKATELRHRLESIKSAELADKAKELSEKGKEVLTSEALEKTSSAVSGAAEKLRNEGLTHGKEAVTAVGAIVGAQSMGEATKGVDGLTKVIESSGKMISSAIDTIKDIFASLFQMLGLDKLFKSIGKLFGMDFPDEEKKQGEEAKVAISAPSDALKDAAKTLETKEGRHEFINNISKSLGDKISNTYFGGHKLSESQMKKLYSILNENLNTESLTKVAERYARGEIQLGELFDATLDMAGAYPAKVMWELSFSGIIPFWAITQHVVLDPASNLIKLTFDGIGFPVSSVSLDHFGSMLEKKAKDGDSHALDMARIQLYGVNSILFRTLGEVLGIAATVGIMGTNTTTGVDGFALAKLSRLKDYDTLAKQFAKIESVLSKGGDVGDFGHMLQGVKDIRTNALIIGAVSTNTVAGKLDHKKIIDALHANPDLKGLNMQTLESVIGDENKFRDALKNLIQGPSSSASWGQAVKRYASKFSGGKNGEALKYLEQVDAVKKGQISLIGDVGIMSEKMRRLKLTYESLKLARAGDTVILHMENMEDISKFRAFLSTIPGGIRALSEVIPAASLAISLGSVAWDARDKKDGTTGESLMDVCKTALLPAYGTWGIIRDKTVNFGAIITKGEMPEFSDIALTGVVGGVFMYEVTRVWTGVAQVGSGVISMDSKLALKGLSKLTYMHDIGRGIGQVGRGLQNIKALASKPIASPEFTKTLSKVAQKFPKKGRLAIGAALLTIAGGAYAYMSGPESPEDIEKSLQKDGWIDTDKHITDKLKTAFYQKTPTERKQLLDELFLMYRGTVDNLPSTYYDETSQSYTIVGNKEIGGLIDSPFRKTIQALGVDIHF